MLYSIKFYYRCIAVQTCYSISVKLAAHPVSIEFLVSGANASDSMWLTFEREGGGVLESDNTRWWWSSSYFLSAASSRSTRRNRSAGGRYS